MNGTMQNGWWITDSGIRNRGGYIVSTIKVQRFEGQDERYKEEAAERKAQIQMMAAAQDLLAALQQLQANPNDPRAHRDALYAIGQAIGGDS